MTSEVDRTHILLSHVVIIDPEKGSPRSNAKGIAEPLDADASLKKLGGKCRVNLRREKASVVALAVILFIAKALCGQPGRGSKFPLWLETYAPELERKTVDRLISLAERFEINEDNVSTFADVFENIGLTALYQLSRPNVPAAARLEVLSRAREGHRITTLTAQQIIDSHSAQPEANEILVDCLRTTTSDDAAPIVLLTDAAENDGDGSTCLIFEKIITLAGGEVIIRVNYEDFRQALTEALEFV